MRSHLISDVNAAQLGQPHDQVVPYPMPGFPSIPVSPSLNSYNLVLSPHVIAKWEVEFTKQWYDLDEFYVGQGHIQERLSKAFVQSQQFVWFYAFTHGVYTEYKVDFGLMTQENLISENIRSIRPAYVSNLEQLQQQPIFANLEQLPQQTAMSWY